MFLVAGKVPLLNVFNTGIAIYQFVRMPIVDPQSEKCYVTAKEKYCEEGNCA